MISGQLFPCDVCHDLAVANAHDAGWATRMVCGLCSREQRLAASCKHCGRKLASSARNPSGRATTHWEGGMGCRDARLLDRRDAAKHRGRNKTASAKGTRVGPKPWSGRQQQREQQQARAGGGGGGGGGGGHDG